MLAAVYKCATKGVHAYTFTPPERRLRVNVGLLRFVNVRHERHMCGAKSHTDCQGSEDRKRSTAQREAANRHSRVKIKCVI